MSSESPLARVALAELIKSLRQTPLYSYLFTNNMYSLYINEIKGADLRLLIEEYPDLLNIATERLESENYSVYVLNFISNSIMSNGSFHKIRLYMDCYGQLLQILDSAKK